MLKLEDIKLLADEGKNYSEIAQITGYTYGYIANYCKNNMVVIKSKNERTVSDIKQFLKNGYNTKEIAEKLNITPCYIRYLCRKNGIALNKRRARKYGGEFVSFCNGHTLDEIEEKYGKNGVQAVHRLNIEHVYKHNGHSPQTYEIINDLKDGLKQSVISRKYNVSRQRISYIKLNLMEKQNGK